MSKDSAIVEPNVFQKVLKPMFHMLTGRPDNMVKVFNKNKIIAFDEIVNLHEQIIEKLNHFQVEGLTFHADLKLSDNINKQFGSWEEFEKHRWNIKNTITTMVLKWDFLIKMPNFETPQRHTVVMRVSSGYSTKEMIQALFSNNFEDADKIELNMSPMFVRVDFVNTRLGMEIIDIVEKWNEALPNPPHIYNWPFKLKKRKKIIADIIRLSIPAFIIILLFSSIELTTKINGFGSDMSIIMYWGLSVAVIFIASSKFGYWLAKRIYHSLDEFGGYSVFELTNGDIQKKEKLEAKNKYNFRIILGGFLFTVVINIISSIFAAMIYELI
ncbi:hypothetical protein SAMN05216353_11260 [Halobacillus alkaliphilus]|uniref:Uncharacterized protein n=1 Tax=Halobacillus alkaliphilus TaxID=396056 RepID=A0A1I2MDL7_9BACI|nr:hypothetical protein [Halobacillus alkaliphilus]SFF89010.1 hypothetical protein SAMN05216353_11260 [Halobacillus alkaliphilus]